MHIYLCISEVQRAYLAFPRRLLFPLLRPAACPHKYSDNLESSVSVAQQRRKRVISLEAVSPLLPSASCLGEGHAL